MENIYPHFTMGYVQYLRWLGLSVAFVSGHGFSVGLGGSI